MTEYLVKINVYVATCLESLPVEEGKRKNAVGIPVFSANEFFESYYCLCLQPPLSGKMSPPNFDLNINVNKQEAMAALRSSSTCIHKSFVWREPARLCFEGIAHS